MINNKTNISSLPPATAANERDYVRNGSMNPSYILDSKHITPTFLNNSYNLKLVDCGEYTQVYFYSNKKIRRNKKDNSDLNLTVKENNNDSKKDKQIEERSIVRSKLECQRMAKANMHNWKTFITLTFAENITNIDVANKKFRYFVDKVRRIYKNFSYICIPEFQKRGAVHYHLLTNIDLDNSKLIYIQEDNPTFKHIKYWNEGFTSVEVMTGDPKKVVGYISKYMTKDVDDRLFGHRRYFYSSNLNKPKESYIDLDDPKQLDFFQKKIQEKEVIYQNSYINTYDNGEVSFLEFL